MAKDSARDPTAVLLGVTEGLAYRVEPEHQFGHLGFRIAFGDLRPKPRFEPLGLRVAAGAQRLESLVLVEVFP